MPLARSRFTGIFKWIGLAVGTYFGKPGLGFTIGATVDQLLWKERTRKRKVPDQKNFELTPETLVTSNAPVPLGFGKFFSTGNILDFVIERNYSYVYTGEASETLVYFIAVGVSANSAEVKSAEMGGLSFFKSTNVFTQFLPEGGKAELSFHGSDYFNPNQAQSEYKSEWYVLQADLPASLDTGWTYVFSDTSFLLVRFSGQSSIDELSDFLDNTEVFLFSKIQGRETSTKLEATDWYWDAANRLAVFYREVTSGWYRFTFSFRPWIRDKYYRFGVFIGDNRKVDDPYSPAGPIFTDLGKTNLNWAFQCNWFLLRFSDQDFKPENSNFRLTYDQGETNPVRALRSYLTNSDWGLAIPEEKIDSASWTEAANRCDEQGWTFNGLFTSQSDPSEIILDFVQIAQAFLVYSQNKFKMVPDVFSTPVKTFQNENIIQDSFQLTKKGIDSSISRLKLDFEDSEHSYAVRSILLDDLELIEKIGIKESSQFLTGVNTKTQAETVGRYLFRSLRQPFTVTFKVSINDADIEPGDLIEIIKPELQFGGVFRIVEVSEEPEGEIQVSGVSFFLESEVIEISGEDDFREGTFKGTKIIQIEDGAVTTS